MPKVKLVKLDIPEAIPRTGKARKSLTISHDISDQLLICSYRECLISESEFIDRLLRFVFENKAIKTKFYKKIGVK